MSVLTKKANPWVPFILFLWLGPWVSGSSTGGAPVDWTGQLGKYAEIYGHIKARYPGTVDGRDLIFSSISGLLKRLDPHSYFLDPVAVRSLNEDQQGNYYGIGTRIAKYEDRLTVISPLVGTPAHRLGIMAGDIIAVIDGKETRGLTVDEAMRMLRGGRDTRVSIEIRREGIAGTIPFSIRRAEIPLNSISYSLRLPWAPGIIYMSIRTFGNTTAAEFQRNMRRLVVVGAPDGLILDLRGNAGGSLYAAVDLADFFLPKDRVIVSVKGRTQGREFRSRGGNRYEHLPLVVLIDRGSASASEILASALQDHRRAVIIGARSWGKGLVQTIGRLSLNTALALTTAKYYTPSNKCLQRDFNDLDDYYFFIGAGSGDYNTDRTIVGGVIPDVFIPPETLPEPVVNLISRGIFFKFARHLVDSGRKISMDSGGDFGVGSGVMEEFKTYLAKKKIDLQEKILEKHGKKIGFQIRREWLSNEVSLEKGMLIFLENDPVTKKAVQVLKKKYK